MKKPLYTRRALVSGSLHWGENLNDVTILLFIVFVILFCCTYPRLKDADFVKSAAVWRERIFPFDALDDMGDTLGDWVRRENWQGSVGIVRTEDAIRLEILDQALAPTGGAVPDGEGIRLLHSLAHALEKLPEPYRLGIESHTDDMPVGAEARDPWGASSRKALAVLSGLNLSPALLGRTSLIAFGETQPVAPNRTAQGMPIPENQRKNRRIVIRIFK